MIVGPDAATCAVIAAALTPLAGGDAAAYASLSAMLALLTGLMCIAASFLRLGALADFLSRPILVGFLNGVALSIILGQADKIFGFPVLAGGIFPRLAEIVGKLGEIHGPTFVVAAGNLCHPRDGTSPAAVASGSTGRHDTSGCCGLSLPPDRLRSEDGWCSSRAACQP